MQLMDQTQYGKHRGISQPRVSNLIKQGKITAASLTQEKGANGKIYTRIIPELADRDLDNNLDPAQMAAKNKANEPSPVVVPDKKKAISFEQARTLNEYLKAELNKIKLSIEQGKYVEAEKINNDWFKAGRQIRDSIEAIPVRVAALVAAESNQFKCQQILESEFKVSLNRLNDIL